MVHSDPQQPTASAGFSARTGAAASLAALGRRLLPAGGVAIDGVDLSQPVPPVAKDRILAAFREHHVVVFHDQMLTRERQFAVAAGFGEVEAPAARGSETKRYAVAHVLSNLDGDGKPIDRSGLPVSNYNWHTDKPYYSTPPMMTMLYAVELPPQGGDTEFANTAMAYAALPAATKRRIAGLRVAFRWGAVRGVSAAATDDLAAVTHPLVRTHPDTGEKALYIGNHASHIVGLPPAESHALLDRLVTHATQPQFVYTHRWRVGDLVMWDNRCLLHRAVANFELSKHRRVMHRSVVRGTLPF